MVFVIKIISFIFASVNSSPRTGMIKSAERSFLIFKVSILFLYFEYMSVHVGHGHDCHSGNMCGVEVLDWHSFIIQHLNYYHISSRNTSFCSTVLYKFSLNLFYLASTIYYSGKYNFTLGNDIASFTFINLKSECF